MYSHVVIFQKKVLVVENKTKTKILFLLHLPPPVHGSSMVGKWIKESKIIKQAIDCRYINLLASNTVSGTGRITIHKIISFIPVLFQLLKELLLYRPDRCYLALTATGVAFYRDVLFIALLKFVRVERIYHLHNKGIAEASNNRLNRLLYKYAFSNAKVILLSESLYTDIERYVSKKRVFICPNGIPDVSVYKPKEFSINKIPKILFLSNLIESKGVWILLEAMSVLKQNNILFGGIFVGGEGDITKTSFQERSRQLNLCDNVRYYGQKFGPEKDSFLHMADIFAFPTYHETFGLVNLEAMQHQLPIVSTEEGAIPEIVEDGVSGFLVPQMDVLSLANRLQQLLEDAELRRSMGMAGRKIYEQKFTLIHFEARMVSILQ